MRVVQQVKSIAKAPETLLMLLHSNHSKAHVRAELESYAGLVTPGSYIVATDGFMKYLHDVPRGDPEWQLDNPVAATLEFSVAYPEFSLEQPARIFNESLLLESLFGEEPVIVIEHRSLFTLKDQVPDIPTASGSAAPCLRRAGAGVKLVGAGVMVPFALGVAAQLATHGVDAEVIARVAERHGWRLRADPVGITHPDSHTSMSPALETAYYPNENDVVKRL